MIPPSTCLLPCFCTDAALHFTGKCCREVILDINISLSTLSDACRCAPPCCRFCTCRRDRRLVALRAAGVLPFCSCVVPYIVLSAAGAAGLLGPPGAAGARARMGARLWGTRGISLSLALLVGRYLREQGSFSLLYSFSIHFSLSLCLSSLNTATPFACRALVRARGENSERDERAWARGHCGTRTLSLSLCHSSYLSLNARARASCCRAPNLSSEGRGLGGLQILSLCGRREENGLRGGATCLPPPAISRIFDEQAFSGCLPACHLFFYLPFSAGRAPPAGRADWATRKPSGRLRHQACIFSRRRKADRIVRWYTVDLPSLPACLLYLKASAVRYKLFSANGYHGWENSVFVSTGVHFLPAPACHLTCCRADRRAAGPTISYLSGASVCRLLLAAISARAFCTGLRTSFISFACVHRPAGIFWAFRLQYRRQATLLDWETSFSLDHPLSSHHRASLSGLHGAGRGVFAAAAACVGRRRTAWLPFSAIETAARKLRLLFWKPLLFRLYLYLRFCSVLLLLLLLFVLLPFRYRLPPLHARIPATAMHATCLPASWAVLEYMPGCHFLAILCLLLLGDATACICVELLLPNCYRTIFLLFFWKMEIERERTSSFSFFSYMLYIHFAVQAGTCVLVQVHGTSFKWYMVVPADLPAFSCRLPACTALPATCTRPALPDVPPPAYRGGRRPVSGWSLLWLLPAACRTDLP